MKTSDSAHSDILDEHSEVLLELDPVIRLFDFNSFVYPSV